MLVQEMLLSLYALLSKEGFRNKVPCLQETWLSTCLFTGLPAEPIPQTARQRRRRKQQLRTRRAQLRELEGRILKQILDRGPDQLCQGVTNLALAEKSESSN
ncbi:rev protein [Simian immunodeficiency virus]|nr:rev protein [Simian immunodeficiency virus]